MKSTSGNLQISLSFLLFVFVSPFSSEANNNDLLLSSRSQYLKQEAEKLIRELNLSPRHYKHSVPHDSLLVPAGKIVEKKFIRFPNLVLDAAAGPSVQDFGRHAGYYGLPHSHGERMFYLFFESRNRKKGGDACESAFYNCNQNIFEQILAASDNVNYYDIRKKYEVVPGCYDFSSMETFLNKKEVRDALGVGDLEYVSCNQQVYAAMRSDWMRNLELGIPALLHDGIRMLVYAGEKDLICNWLGNARWVNAMDWSGQKAFLASLNVSFVVDGKEAGKLQSHEPLTFLKIHEAGRLVPMDQPKVALEMLTRWLQGKLTHHDKRNNNA
ncbi:serine carboxypeptidase-like 47 [Prosopis cineraria]|uniref:serine carboxypeptidase-like 47 n=1 Tax=Prosopis cineraria TaxID=364024 RepID=UPI002410A5F2|nr:serine carboxypeptidase-like 47 [Prosopis cineraria]